MFQSLTGPTSHSNRTLSSSSILRGVVSIPNGPHKPFQLGNFAKGCGDTFLFQSLTGPTSHSNKKGLIGIPEWILVFQSLTGPTSHSNVSCQAFHPPVLLSVSIPNGPHKPFQRRAHSIAWEAR